MRPNRHEHHNRCARRMDLHRPIDAMELDLHALVIEQHELTKDDRTHCLHSDRQMMVP